MEEFDFEIKHRAGASHGNADSLSKMIPRKKAGGPCSQCHKHERLKRGQRQGESEEGRGVLECFGVTTRAQKRRELEDVRPSCIPTPARSPTVDAGGSMEVAPVSDAGVGFPRVDSFASGNNVTRIR